MKKLFTGKKAKTIITILTVVAMMATTIPMAMAAWVVDPEGTEVRVTRAEGVTEPAEFDDLDYVRTETEDGDPIYGDAPIEGYEQIPVYDDGTEPIGYIDGNPIFGEDQLIGYEQKNKDSSIVERTDIKDSGNSGTYKGTPGNGQKFNEKPTTMGISILNHSSNPTILVPAGVTATVRVQLNNVYKYFDVTGPTTYVTGGNNAWVHDVQAATEDDYNKPIYEKTIIGYEQIPVYDDGTEPIGYIDGDPIYGDAPIEGYKQINIDIYMQLIWEDDELVEDEPEITPATWDPVFPTETPEEPEAPEEPEEIIIEDEPEILSDFEAVVEEPEEEVLIEEEVPLAEAPATGDFATMTIAVFVAFLSLTGIVILITTTKKAKN